MFHFWYFSRFNSLLKSRVVLCVYSGVILGQLLSPYFLKAIDVALRYFKLGVNEIFVVTTLSNDCCTIVQIYSRKCHYWSITRVI